MTRMCHLCYTVFGPTIAGAELEAIKNHRSRPLHRKELKESRPVWGALSKHRTDSRILAIATLNLEEAMKIALDLFKESTDYQMYGPGEEIFAEGQKGDFMYVLVDGEVEIVAKGMSVRALSTGDIFGEMALIDDSPRCASAIARSTCKVVPVDQYHFTFLIQHSPLFAIEVMSVMADRLRRELA